MIPLKDRIVHLSECSLEFCTALSLKVGFINWLPAVQCAVMTCLSTRV